MNLAMSMPADLEQVRHDWGWMMVFGAFLIFLGLVAVGWSLLATIATMVFIGALLLVSGVLEIGSAIGHYRSHHFWLHLFAGALDLAFGALVLLRPLAGALVLTLVLAAFLLVGGIIRVSSSVSLRLPGWGWELTSGIVNILLAILLLTGWPVTGLWFIGFCIGLALLFRGLAWAMLGFFAHRSRREAIV